jgi:hypothetical protein
MRLQLRDRSNWDGETGVTDSTEAEADWLWEGLLEQGEIPMATTDVVDGECLTRDALVQMAEQVQQAPPKINVEHVPGVNPIGWIESARVVALRDGEYGLIGRERRLTANDFHPPSSLIAPTERPPDDKAPDRIPLRVTYDERDFAPADIAALDGLSNDRLSIRTFGGARRYSVEPVIIVALTIAAFPFVKRLSEHLADDTHEALKRGLGALVKRKRRRTQDTSIYYVFEHRDRHGVTELVAQVSTVETLGQVWANLDAGLATGKAWLSANRRLRSVCLVWSAEAATWQVSYAVTKEYQVVAASAVMGITTAGGVKIVRIDTSSRR